MSYLRPTKSSTLRQEEQKEKQEAVLEKSKALLAKRSTMRSSMKAPNTARSGKVQPGPRGATSRLSESIIKDEEVKMVKNQPQTTTKKATTPRVGKPLLPTSGKKPTVSSNEKSSGTKSLAKKPEVPRQPNTARPKLNTGLKTSARRPSTKESPQQEEDSKNSGQNSGSKAENPIEQTPTSSEKKAFLKKDPSKITLSEGLRSATARRVKKQDSARDSIVSLLNNTKEKRSIVRRSVGSNGSMFFGSQNKENMSDGSKEILFQPDSFKESLVITDILEKKVGKIEEKKVEVLLDMDSELKFTPRSVGEQSLMSGVSSHDDGLFQLASSTLKQDKEESIQALLMRNTVVESENNVNEFTVGKIRQQEVKEESVYIEEFTVGNMRKKVAANSQRSQSLSSMTEDDIDSQEFQIARQFNDEQNEDNSRMLAGLQQMQDQIQQRKRELDDKDNSGPQTPVEEKDVIKSLQRKELSPDKDSVNQQDSLPNVVIDDTNSVSMESGSQILVSNRVLSPSKNNRGGAEISFDAKMHVQNSKSPQRSPNKPPHMFRSINASKSQNRMNALSSSQRHLDVSPNPGTRKSLVSPRTGSSRSGLESSDSFRTANARNKSSDPIEYQSCGARSGQNTAVGKAQSKDENFTANFDVESQAREYGIMKQNQEIILGSFVQSNTDSAVKNVRPAANLGFSFQVGPDGSPGNNPLTQSITKYSNNNAEIATISVTAIPMSSQTQKQAIASSFVDNNKDRIIIELPADTDQKQDDDKFEKSLTQQQQEQEDFDLHIQRVKIDSFSEHTEVGRKSQSGSQSVKLVSVCSNTSVQEHVQVVEQEQVVPQQPGPLPEDLRGSIVDNGELFEFLQKQYDDKQEALHPSMSIKIDLLSDHNKSTITDEDKMTLEEKIKLRKAKLQTDKKLCVDPKKTLQKLDISDLGDHREYTSPHFNKFQFKNTNNFRLDEENEKSDIDFKFREEDDVDIELRNHKMNLSSSTEKSKSWLKDIQNEGLMPQRKLSIEIQTLDDIKKDSHRHQQNVKPSKEKPWKPQTNPEEIFIPKNEEESWDVTLSKTDQSMNVSNLYNTQKMQSLQQKPITNDFSTNENKQLLTPPCPGKHKRRDSETFEPQSNRRPPLPDDTKSNYSRISKISKFTNNMMNKSNIGVNDQWYQFIYNDNLLNDSLSDMNDNKSDDNRSRFTLHSKISNTVRSNFSKMSKLQKQLDQRKSPLNSKRKNLFSNKSPTEILTSLIDEFDICRFIRISWLISPMINSRYVKSRLFNFRNHQVMKMIENLTNPLTKAICLYLSDELHLCQIMCQKCRQIYLKQKTASKKDKQFLSQDIAKIYIIELACLLDMINYEAEFDSPVKEQQRKAFYRAKAHDVIEEIPILVKNKNQHQFTIIELLVQYKEKRAYSKLKDLDFISYRLFKLERALWVENQAKLSNNKAGADINHMYNEPDEYEEKTPEQYAQEIQKQFTRVAEQEQTIKMVEYFIFGALSAFRNHHYTEAWNFVSQAPFVCNFGEQITDIETLVVFEMLKMVELKLLTKIGRPEQAVIQLTSRYFRNKVIDDPQYQALFPYSANQQNSLPFQSALFMDQTWCLYKQMKYYSRLIEFRQDHFKFKMVSMQSQDYNWDAQMLQKANDDQCNQIYKLWFIVKALRFYERKYKSKDRLKMFEWMLIKTIMKLDKNNQTQQMISNENFNALYQRIDVISFIQELQSPSSDTQFMLPQLKKHSNRMLIQDYISKYIGRVAQKSQQQTSSPEQIQKPKSILDQRLSFNQKSGLFEKGEMDQDVLGQNRIGMERYYARMIQQSAPQFYIMLQHIIDFVQYKVIQICQFVFYETMPKNAHRQQFHHMDFMKQYESSTTSKQKSKTFQNYFDLLKTDSYHKQVRNLQQALNLFLASTELIVFQNLTQVQELVEYDLQKKEEYRAIETIYINEHYYKEKNGGNNQIYASGDEQYSNLNFTQMSQSGFGMMQNDYSQSYLAISQDFEKLKQETSNNFGSHLSIKKQGTEFPQNVGSSRLNETQMQQNKRRIDQHIMKNMQNPNQTQNNGNQQRSSIVEVKNFRDLSEVNRRRNNQISKFEASDDNSSMVIYEGGEKSTDGKQQSQTRKPRFEKGLRAQNPSPFKSIVRDKSAASALTKRTAKRERSEFRIKKIEYFNKSTLGSPDFPKSRKQQEQPKVPELKPGSLGGDRQEEGDFLIEMNQSIQQKSRVSRTLSSRRSSSQKGRNLDQNQYNFNFLTKQSPLGPVALQPENGQDQLFVKSPVGSNHNDFNLGRQTINANNFKPIFIEPVSAQPRASVPVHGCHQRTPTHTDLCSPDPYAGFNRPLDQNSADEICNNIDALSKSQVDMSVPGLSALGIVLEDTYNIGPSQISDATPTQMDEDEEMEDDEDDSSDFSDEENVSIHNLIQSEEEKMNFEMIGHTIYSEQQLYDLCMACCLADTHQKLAIRIISVLMKIRSQQKALKIKCETYMRYLDIMMAYVFLRLNYKQFQMQQNNLNTSRILPTRQSGMYQNITDFSRNDTISHLQNTTGVNTSSCNQVQQNSMIGQSNQHTTRNANLKQRILTNLQNQDYFLQQALKYFKQFEPNKYFKKNQILDEQDAVQNIMVMMFLHVQNELDQYKLLKRDQPDSQQIYSAKKCNKSSAFKIIVQNSKSKSKKYGKDKKKKDNLKSRSFLKGSFAQPAEPNLRKSFNANNFFTTSIHENASQNMFVSKNDNLRKSVRLSRDDYNRDSAGSHHNKIQEQLRGTLTSRLSGQRRTANFGMNFGRRTPSSGGKNFDTDDERDFQQCRASPLGAIRGSK